MRQTEVLHEYLTLNPWSGSPRKRDLKDRLLAETHLLRETGNTVTLYFLESGQSLVIPRDYFQIMRSLDVCSGEKIHYTEEASTRLDLFLAGLARVTKLIDTTSKGESGQEIIDLLMTLASLGTVEVRRFLTDHSVDIKPWFYEEPRKTLEL